MNITTDLVYGLLISNQYDVPKEAVILNAMQGPVRYLGLKEMAEEIQTQKAGRESAEKATREQTKVLDAGTKKYLGLDPGAQVTAEQRKVFTDAVSAAGDDAPDVIRPKPKAAEGQAEKPPEVPKDEFREIFAKMAHDFDVPEAGQLDWAKGVDATLRALKTKFDEDDSPDKADFFKWAGYKIGNI